MEHDNIIDEWNNHLSSVHHSMALWSFLNTLKLISPKTWIGIFLFMDQLGLNTSSFWVSLFGLFVILPITLLQSNPSPSFQINAAQILKVFSVTLFSPLSIEYLTKTILPVGKEIYNKLKVWKDFRKNTLPEAQKLYQKSLMDKRIIRTRHYDAYLPLSISKKGHTQNCSKSSPLLLPTTNHHHYQGILFFPGAMIDHTSYVEVALQLADAGVLVVIPSMEPLRLASPWLGADTSHVSGILNHVQKRIHGKIQWAFGGHSLGGYAALRIASQLKKHKVKKKHMDDDVHDKQHHTNISNKVVVWAAGNLLDSFLDESNLIHLHCLFIQASEDNFCTFPTRQKVKEFKQKFSSHTIHKCIRGGNHCGFASYPMDLQIDGEQKISRKRQQQYASRETSQFLLRTREFKSDISYH